MGGALGLAILSTIASGQTQRRYREVAARAITDGFDLAFTVAAVFALVARDRRGRAAELRGRTPAEVATFRSRSRSKSKEAVAA